MDKKQKLWYLMDGLLNNSYKIKIFCSEFSRVYDLEVDYEELSQEENTEFGDLCDMCSRFSDNMNELQIPNMYFNEEQVRNKVKYIYEKISRTI